MRQFKSRCFFAAGVLATFAASLTLLIALPAVAMPLVVAQAAAEEVAPDPAPGEPQSNPDQPATPANARKTPVVDESLSDPFSELRDGDAKEENDAPVHPLVAARPADNVVVCDGGCAGAESVVVYAEPRTAQQSVPVAELKPTAFEGATKSSKPEIACVAGCYDIPRSYAARLPILAPLTKPKSAKVSAKKDVRPVSAGAISRSIASGKAAGGQWLTTVTSQHRDKPPTTSVSESWMEKINKERGQ